jgi:NAD(P)-dependent dehydrogenase (short-subunit alcohol dehydrogenase family)
MDLQLRDEVAVVIGGASGIGKAIAEEYAAEGAKVILVDIAPSIQDVAAEIQRVHSATTGTRTADVTDLAAMQQVAESVIADSGRCDHVVVAAGIGSGKFGFPFWNLEPSDWDRVLQVNIMGPVHAAHAFSPAMIEKRHGTFLFFASVAAQIGSQTDPPYSAAKAAVVNFAQCAAKDLAPHNIRVNTISPGMVQTPLNRSVWKAWNDRQPDEAKQPYDEWAGEKVRKVAPLGRWQTPQDCAAVAVFLASHRAQNITGQTINVDGGQVMHA